MTPLLALQLFILAYFAAINLLYTLSMYIAARELGRRLRRGEHMALSALLERQIYKPISILVPAYNEEATIAASVGSFLNLQYPEYEVIVISDGSRDRTIATLVARFGLEPITQVGRKLRETKFIRAVYRSRAHPNLLVIDKDNGGKADALNAGLIYARYPLYCAVDADSLLDAQALLRVARQFVEDESLLAVGGTIRVLNNADVSQGRVREVRAPEGWLERFQTIEYTRAFLTGRTTLSAAGMLLVISGAFGLFRSDVVREVGGYKTDTVGEDMELVMRLHRWAREQGHRYRIAYSVDPICWTQVPGDWRTLRRQRDRWQRGLWEALWQHRSMAFNPRYGRIGMLAVPLFWTFEAVAPTIEAFGYVLFGVLLATGNLEPTFALAFASLAVLYGMLVSVAALGIEVFMQTRFPRLDDRLVLLTAALLENFGYRQTLSFVRFWAGFRVWRKRGQWGEMRRREIL